MRDSTYVMLALALCSLVALALHMQKPRGMYMLDLEDFRVLPVELRSALRRMLPDPVTIRQRWAHMTPDQKRNAIQQIGGFIPQPQRPPSHYMPHPSDVAPEQIVEPTPEPEQIVEPTSEPEQIVEPTPEPEQPTPEPLKKGFLDAVKKGKKKDAKHKKEDEMIALGAVGADVSSDETPRGASGFLGRDE
jgi:hypothetical protein